MRRRGRERKWAPKGTLSEIVASYARPCVTCGMTVEVGRPALIRSMCVYLAHPECGFAYEKGNYQ